MITIAGIDFPEIEKINIGKCPADKNHTQGLGQVFFNVIYGHAHPCKKEKYFANICIMDEKLIEKDDRPSEIIWHEYAHILATHNLYDPYIEIFCESNNKHTFAIESTKDRTVYDKLLGLYQNPHGPEWVKIMESFGFPAVPWLLDSELAKRVETPDFTTMTPFSVDYPNSAV